MATIKDIVKAYNVTPQTVRNWTSRYADYLSAGANPPTGQTRQFSDADLGTFDLIARMRQGNQAFDSIEAALAAGDRGEPPPPGQQPPRRGPQSTEIDTIDRLQQFAREIAAPYRVQIEQLRTEISNANREHVNAAVKAGKLEVENELLAGQKQALEAKLEALEGKLEAFQYRRHWYQFWKPEPPDQDKE